ncbi:unnamed protein product [Prunus armeniaca]
MSVSPYMGIDFYLSGRQFAKGMLKAAIDNFLFPKRKLLSVQTIEEKLHAVRSNNLLKMLKIYNNLYMSRYNVKHELKFSISITIHGY